jgi:hypothetical protein
MIYGDASSVTTALNSLVGDCSATIVVNTTAVLDSGAYAASPMSSTNSSATLLLPLLLFRPLLLLLRLDLD